MEKLKTSPKIEFDVIYADGTRRRVQEGVLFEVENERMYAHIGTSRLEVVFTVPEAVNDLVEALGLRAVFDKFIQRGRKEKAINQRRMQ